MTDHRKTIDIERLLIWAYRDQRADRFRDGEVYGFPGSVDSCLQVAEIAAIGCKIDRSPAYGGPDVHPDASAVVDAVERIDAPFKQLIPYHARVGTRPDDKLAAQVKLIAKTEWKGKGANAKPRHVVLYSYDQNHNKPWLCPLIEMNDRKVDEARRRVYTLWLEELTALRVMLAPILESHCPVGPKAPQKPWEKSQLTPVGEIG